VSIAWSDIKNWNAAGVDDAGTQVKARIDELSRLADGLSRQHPREWHGAASDQAREERVRLVGIYDDLGHETDPLKRALWSAADAIATLRRDQEAVEDQALFHDMFVNEAGELLTEIADGPLPGTPEAEERLQIALALRDELERIKTQAGIIDEDLANALRRAAYPAKYPDENGNQSRLNPPPNGKPSEINDWWLGLSEEERNELIATRPAWVGSTDGIPAEYRDTANRQVLVDQRADLTTQLGVLKDRLRANPLDGELLDQINATKAKISGIDDIRDRLEHPKTGEQDAYLLGIDGKTGQAIIAMGNPDTATNVATFVPGTGAGLDSIGGEMSRADSMAEAARKAGSPSTSVITWVGYAAPQDLAEAADPSYAENAEYDLDQFQNGLRATHEGVPSHNTVIGHSYGSTVIGHTAASDGLNADDVVFVGSPGVGVDHAADLNMSPMHVHATVAEHDVIQASNLDLSVITGFDTDVHGPDPTGGGFGAHVFESDPGTKGSDYAGGLSGEAHSEYWEPNNKALANMGRIIAGEPTS
jgi:hypothetical protein